MFSCGFCLENFPDSAKIPVGSDALCTDCYTSEIKPKFLAALKDEPNFPVRWGSTAIEPGRGFSATFKIFWRERVKEYEAPPATRIYCKHIVDDGKTACGKYAGTKSDQGKAGRAISCIKCRLLSCSKCAAALGSSKEEHECSGEDSLQVQDPFAGLVKEKHYQICPKPSCAIPVELRDGCNHVICERCFTHFCMICGVPAQGGSDRWKVGSACPRWGHPDAANALHDGDAVAADFGYEEDGEDVGNRQDGEFNDRVEDDDELNAEDEAERQRFEAEWQEREQRLADDRERRLADDRWQEHVRRQLPPIMLPTDAPEMILFTQQQHALVFIIRDASRLRAVTRDNGEQVPGWTGWTIHFASILKRNLQYAAMDKDAMHWQTVQQQRHDKEERHGRLLDMLPRITEAMGHYPHLSELFHGYMDLQLNG